MRVGHEAAKGARVQAPAAGGEKEGVVGTAGELRARLAHVAGQPQCGLLAERHRSLLSALAADVQELLVEVDVCEVEVDRLATPQPGRVDELDERAVPQCQGTVA